VCCKGKEIDFKEMRTPEQKEMMAMLFDTIKSNMGQGATPFMGPLSAGPNPAQLAAMNTMMQMGGYGGYQAPQFPMYPYEVSGRAGQSGSTKSSPSYGKPSTNVNTRVTANPKSNVAPNAPSGPGGPGSVRASTDVGSLSATVHGPSPNANANPYPVMGGAGLYPGGPAGPGPLGPGAQVMFGPSPGAIGPMAPAPMSGGRVKVNVKRGNARSGAARVGKR
jgi:hypothetical protein